MHPTADYLDCEPTLDLIPCGLSVETDLLRVAHEQKLKQSLYLEYHDTSHQWFSFSGQRMRERHLWLSVSARSDDGLKRFCKMLDCRSTLLVEYSPSADTHRVTVPTCGNRFCPYCCEVLGAERSDKIRQALRDAEDGSLKLLTIAPAHIDAPLAEQLDELTAGFRRLRQRKCWSEHYDYGTAVIEVKIHEKGETQYVKRRSGNTRKIVHDGLWHCHLHVICHGAYFDQAALLQECRSAFRRECSVDIRAIKDNKRAIEYCSKYVAKPCRSRALYVRRDKALELYNAMFRRKTCWTWGDHPEIIKPDKPESVERVRDWRTVYTFGQVCRAIIDNDKMAIGLFKSLDLPIASYKSHYERGSPCLSLSG